MNAVEPQSADSTPGARAVDVHNITVEHGGRRALRGVSCHAPAGRITALVGPNGCGKSTLLGAMSGALVPSSGTVHLFGTPTCDYGLRRLARVRAVVPQRHTGYVEFTAADMVRLGCDAGRGAFERSRRSDTRRVAQALAATDASALAERKFAELSGGEQQRVLIARALAQQAPLMLLDEPTNHLDLATQLSIMDLIAEMDATVVVALHDLNFARHYADHVVLLRRGRVAAQGPAEDVLTPRRISRTFGIDVEEVTYPGTSRRHFLFSSPGRATEPP